MKTYTVEAVRWEEGWELYVAGVGVTQVRTLDKADQQVRAFIETMTDEHVKKAAIVVFHRLDGLEDEVQEARRLVEEAAMLQVAAAAKTRKVAHALRTEKHLSVTDTAAVLGVSRGRVSQLTA